MEAAHEWVNRHIRKFNLDYPNDSIPGYGDLLANFTIMLITETMQHSMKTKAQVDLLTKALDSLIQSDKDLVGRCAQNPAAPASSLPSEGEAPSSKPPRKHNRQSNKTT